MNFKTFEDYLRELERAQTDRRTDRQTDRETNRMHKHFSTLLESVKKERDFGQGKTKRYALFKPIMNLNFSMMLFFFVIFSKI